jgi:hypothetical protein
VKFLPGVSLDFEDSSGPLSADKRGRNVMYLSDSGETTEFHQVTGSVDVRFPRLTVIPRTQTDRGGGMNDRATVSSDPAPVGLVQSGTELQQVAAQDSRRGDATPGRRGSEVDQLLNPLCRRNSLLIANQ